MQITYVFMFTCNLMWGYFLLICLYIFFLILFLSIFLILKQKRYCFYKKVRYNYYQQLINMKVMQTKKVQYLFQYKIMSRAVDQYHIDNSIKECIHNVSQSNKYQHKLIIFISFIACAGSILIYGNNLLYMNPVFDCQGSNQKMFEEDACPQLQFCTIHDTETVTAELHLYCDSRKTDRTLIQSAQGLGAAISLILTSFSDRFGKKFTLCGCLVFLNFSWIFQFVGVHFQASTLLFISEIISGLAGKALYICLITLLTRFFKKEKYEAGTLIMLIALHGVSQVVMACINAIFDDWRAVAYVYSVAILGSTIASFFVLKEDPLFLFNTGKISEVKRIVEEIGRENGAEEQIILKNVRKIDEIFQEKMRMVEKNVESKVEFNIKQLCRCDIMQTIFILGLVACFYQMDIKGIELSIQSLEYSFNFNLFIVGISNIFGFASAIYINKVEDNQKRGLITTTITCSIIALLFMFPFCTDNGNVETIVIVLMRVLLCWSCHFFTRLKVDSFPEKYQMLIIGIIQFLGNIGIIMAPTIVQVSIDHYVNPILVINVLRFIFGILPIFLLFEGKIHLDKDEGLPEEVKRSKEEQLFIREQIRDI